MSDGCRGRKRKNVPVEEIVERYSHGERLRSMAEEYNVSYDLLRERLMEAGHELCQTGTSRIELPIDNIVERYNRGENLREIAEDYPASHETIRQRIVNAGVDTSERQSIPDPTKEVPIKEAAERHKNGEYLKDIAGDYDVCANTLSVKLRNSGYKTHRHGPRSTLDLPVEKMAEDYRDGASLRELSEKYPACPMTIRRRLVDMGVEMRPQGSHNRTRKE